MRASLVLFLFLLPTASATSLLFDSYVSSGTNFTVDWHSFVVSWTDKGIFFKSDLRDFFITTEPCERAFPYIICVNSTQPSSPDKQFRVTVAKENPLLQIQRIYSTNEAEAGTFVTVDVTLTNLGSDDIHHVDYRDTYPETLKIFGRTLSGNTYQQTVEVLHPSASVRFKYTIMAEAPMTFLSTAHAAYTVMGREEETFSPHLLLKIDPVHIVEPFEIIPVTEQHPLELDQEALVSILIRNNQQEELQLPYVDVEVPEALTVEPKDFHKQGLKYVAQGSVQPHSIRQFLIGVIPKKEGSYELKMVAGGSVMNGLLEKSIVVYLNPSITPLEKASLIQYNVSDNVLGLMVRITNNNQYTTFDDVHIKLASPVFQFDDAVFNRIKPGETKDAFVQKLEMDKALRNPLLTYTAEYHVDTAFYKQEDFVYLGQPKEDVFQETGEVLQLAQNVPPEVTIDASVKQKEEVIQKETPGLPSPVPQRQELPSGNIVVVRPYQDHSPIGSLKIFFARVLRIILS